MATVTASAASAPVVAAPAAAAPTVSANALSSPAVVAAGIGFTGLYPGPYLFPDPTLSPRAS